MNKTLLNVMIWLFFLGGISGSSSECGSSLAGRTRRVWCDGDWWRLLASLFGDYDPDSRSAAIERSCSLRASRAEGRVSQELPDSPLP